MTEPAAVETVDEVKPCVALMGEFSAGKSTLANVMLGASPLPVQVIATRLPPVRISFGTSPAYRLDLNRERHPVDLSDLADIALDDTQLIQIFREDDVLTACDLIDMPGISDPNMSAEVWQRVLPLADAVVWCTHATQAWRQSEAAVWDQIDDAVRKRSLLLLTRIDMVPDPSDRQRLLRRVEAAVGDHIQACLPIALLMAQSAGDDMEKWKASGADAFAQAFIGMVERTKVEKSGGVFTPADPAIAEPPPEPAEKVIPRRVRAYGRS